MFDNEFLGHYCNAYLPKVQDFFNNLDSLHLPQNELNCIPGLFLPCSGTLYNESLVKIAFIGKETYGWNDSIADNLNEYLSGNYDVLSSINLFRDKGPVEWRNTFWWYVAESLAMAYGLNAHDVLNPNATTPLIKCFAWSNCYNIETWASKGVEKDDLRWSTMEKVQELTKKADISNIDTFIDVFKPNVIVQMFRNADDPESSKIISNADFIKTWGVLEEYSYRDVIILRCAHPTRLRYDGVGRAKLATMFREILSSHDEFKLLGSMKLYIEPEQCESFIALANKMADESSELSDRDTSRNIIAAIALELRKQEAWMTACCLVSILNRVNRFLKSGWQYSTHGRGPCAVVRGVYNYIAGLGNYELADFVAMSFTKTNGEIAWE